MKLVRLFAVAALAAASAAHAYDVGDLTCEDMGTFGSEAMAARTHGTSKADYLKSLEQRPFKADLDRRNATDIALLIYDRLGDTLYDEKAAYGVIRTDCTAGQKKQR